MSALLSDNIMVGLDPKRVAVDVRDFEDSAAGNDADALARATALYRGSFLEDLQIEEVGFQDWLTFERRHFDELAQDSLETLLELQLAVPATQAAIKTGQALLVLDPLREGAHRGLMQAYAAQGRTAQAITQFEECKRVLGGELGLEPSEETRQLHEKLRRGEQGGERGTTLSSAVPSQSSKDGDQDIMPKVVVFPLEVLSDQPQHAYLAQGIALDIVTELSRFRRADVLFLRRWREDDQESASALEQARALDGDFLVDGNLRHLGQKLRISVQLVETTSGRHLWGENYDCSLEEIYATHDDVVQAVTAAVANRLDFVEYEQAQTKPEASLTADEHGLGVTSHEVVHSIPL